MSTLWLGRWVQGRFPRLLKQILAWKRSTAMRKRDIKIGLLSSGPSMIPICLSPGDPSASLDQKGIRLRAFPLSKRWVSLTVPLQSLPVSQEAPNKGLPFLPSSVSAAKEIQHIFMRLSGISCFIIKKERIVSASQSWNMWHQEMVWYCYSLVWEKEWIFLARRISDDAVQKLVGQHGISRGEKQHAVWRIY